MRLVLRIEKLGALGLVASAMLACSELTAAGAGVRESDGRGLEACEYLGDFVGRSGASYLARIDALNAAGKGGATVIVWDQVGAVSWPNRIGFISGKGYRCP